ncbi:MAG: DUF692 domain-containing protein [Polyangiaceae bacterium]
MPELRAGVGLGLRWEILEDVASAGPLPIDFFEIAPENYLGRGGLYPALLERVAERYPLSSHGLSSSLGGSAALDHDYLRALKALLDRLGCGVCSDHLCFASAGDAHLHELLPVAFRREHVQRVAARVREVADALQRPLWLENITYYAHSGRRELSEAEFLSRVLEASDAGLLLDLNNVFVNAYNQGRDPLELLENIPLERVREIHVAGHELREQPARGATPARRWCIDSHGADVCEEVLGLLEWTLQRTGPVPVLLERDNRVPPLELLLLELARVRGVYERALVAWRSGQEQRRAS